MVKQIFNANDIPWVNKKVGKVKKLVGSEIIRSASVRMMCLAPQEEFKTHEHDFLQIMYFAKGEGKVSVDETTYPISSGLIVIVMPNQCHSVINASAEDLEIMIFETFDLKNDESPFIDF